MMTEVLYNGIYLRISLSSVLFITVHHPLLDKHAPFVSILGSPHLTYLTHFSNLIH